MTDNDFAADLLKFKEAEKLLTARLTEMREKFEQQIKIIEDQIAHFVNLQTEMTSHFVKACTPIETELRMIEIRRQETKDRWNALAGHRAEYFSVLQKDTPDQTNKKIRRSLKRIRIARERAGLEAK